MCSLLNHARRKAAEKRKECNLHKKQEFFCFFFVLQRSSVAFAEFRSFELLQSSAFCFFANFFNELVDVACCCYRYCCPFLLQLLLFVVVSVCQVICSLTCAL